MKPTFTPILDRILVEPGEIESQVGSIIIPDSAKELPQRGTVVAVGLGKVNDPMTLKEGDSILYGKYTGVLVELEGKNYLIMKESDVFANLE